MLLNSSSLITRKSAMVNTHIYIYVNIMLVSPRYRMIKSSNEEQNVICIICLTFALLLYAKLRELLCLVYFYNTHLKCAIWYYYCAVPEHRWALKVVDLCPVTKRQWVTVMKSKLSATFIHSQKVYLGLIQNLMQV